ncbi:hypothetical protein TVAG_411300 [Trichomonas vaginalis G3]|uniref:Uncharacterized protein n=1 Tax=Trichomonas vaginalis (strain ATCC PRA-98 / G3) TaxID=412133 RepID=A2DXN5_TRIV3|nr:Ankyrin repeat family [Trichomonas vaginalis G3]EAY14864.1 hypothetical protein TVAG_411300 [Trichomonas vaginalis G3]KAI5541155.1 Ankyrin repeat family [Trichomonas vaginalis G3]|eukprot:XP_001327087.1 hypothetical protein [Trichomonas vaginalis G3]
MTNNLNLQVNNDFLEAFENDNVDDMELIGNIEYLMSLEAKNKLNYFQYACFLGKNQVAAYFDSINRYIYSSIDQFGNTPLHLIASNPKNEDFQLAEYFINKYKSEILHSRNVFGLTPFHVSCLQSNINFVKYLLTKYSKEIDLTDEENIFKLSPVNCAKKANCKEIIALLTNKTATEQEQPQIINNSNVPTNEIENNSELLNKIKELTSTINTQANTISEKEKEIQKLQKNIISLNQQNEALNKELTQQKSIKKQLNEFSKEIFKFEGKVNTINNLQREQIRKCESEIQQNQSLIKSLEENNNLLNKLLISSKEEAQGKQEELMTENRSLEENCHKLEAEKKEIQKSFEARIQELNNKYLACENEKKALTDQLLREKSEFEEKYKLLELQTNTFVLADIEIQGYHVRRHNYLIPTIIFCIIFSILILMIIGYKK